MSQRGESLVRIWAFLWSFTFAALISGLITIVGFIWAIFDILWQLISGRNDLSESSTPARVIRATLLWNVGLMVYAMTGSGEFEWLPSW